MSVKKTLALILLAVMLTVAGFGCSSTKAAEQKYQASFKKTWDTLMAQNKKTTEKSKASLDAGDIPEVIKSYGQLSTDHKKAEKDLDKLKPPKSMKKLHDLMKVNLKAGYEYADLVVKILSETDGNYSDEQEKELKKKEKAWLGAQEKVNKELKKYFRLQP